MKAKIGMRVWIKIFVKFFQVFWREKFPVYKFNSARSLSDAVKMTSIKKWSKKIFEWRLLRSDQRKSLNEGKNWCGTMPPPHHHY